MEIKKGGYFVHKVTHAMLIILDIYYTPIGNRYVEWMFVNEEQPNDTHRCGYDTFYEGITKHWFKANDTATAIYGD